MTNQKQINGVQQINIEEVTKRDLKFLSSIKHRMKQISGFGELNLKLTIKNNYISNVKYVTIEDNDNLG